MKAPLPTGCPVPVHVASAFVAGGKAESLSVKCQCRSCEAGLIKEGLRDALVAWLL